MVRLVDAPIRLFYKSMRRLRKALGRRAIIKPFLWRELVPVLGQLPRQEVVGGLVRALMRTLAGLAVSLLRVGVTHQPTSRNPQSSLCAPALKAFPAVATLAVRVARTT